MKIVCVIPAYNEEKNISRVIEEVRPLVDEIVVVDDGSEDNTYDLIKRLPVTVLRHLINRGQGAALKTGTNYAIAKGADIIIHFDADGQFLAADIERVTAPIIKGQADMVFGSRFLDRENKSDMPILKKYLIMPLAKFVNRILFKVNLTDPQSGFRAMTSQVASLIEWQQDRMAHCSEILFEVKRHNLKVKEVPIKVIYHNFGQRLFDGIKIIKDLFVTLLLNQ